jgi:hypothetical protein
MAIGVSTIIKFHKNKNETEIYNNNYNAKISMKQNASSRKKLYQKTPKHVQINKNLKLWTFLYIYI